MEHLSWFASAVETSGAEIDRVIESEAAKLAAFSGKKAEEAITDWAKGFLETNFDELDDAAKTKFLKSVVGRRDDFAKLFSGVTNVVDERLLRFIGIDVTDWPATNVHTDAAKPRRVLSSLGSSFCVEIFAIGTKCNVVDPTVRIANR